MCNAEARMEMRKMKTENGEYSERQEATEEEIKKATLFFRRAYDIAKELIGLLIIPAFLYSLWFSFIKWGNFALVPALIVTFSCFLLLAIVKSVLWAVKKEIILCIRLRYWLRRRLHNG